MRLYFSLLLMLTLFPLSLDAQQDQSPDTALINNYLKQASEMIDRNLVDQASTKLEQAIAVFDSGMSKESKAYADWLSQKGRIYFHKEDYEKAAEAFREALTVRLRINNLEEKGLAIYYSRLGNAYARLRDYNRAIENWESCLTIRQQYYKKSDPLIVKLQFSLSTAYFVKGDYEKAKKNAQIALAETRKSEPGSAYEAQIELYLGRIFRVEGEYEKAIQSLHSAEKIYTEKDGASSFSVARVYILLGPVYFALRDHKKAQEYFQWTLDILLEKIGEKHKGVAQCYMGLGAICTVESDFDLALDYYYKADAVYQRIYGPEHLEIASNYNNIGETYRRMDELNQALDYHHKAVAIRQKALEKDHPKLASSYHNIALIYYAKDEYQEALGYFEKALTILKNKFGEVHPEITRIERNIGMLYLETGDYHLALQYQQEVMKHQLELYGRQNPEVAQTATNMVVIHGHQGTFETGETYIQQALDALFYKNIESLDQVSSIPLLLSVFKNEGRLYFEWYLQKKNPKHLLASRQAYLKASQVLEYQHKYLIGEESKYPLGANFLETYDKIIEVNLCLWQLTDSSYYQQEAFHFSEQSKSFVLFSAMKDAAALQYAGIPENLLQEEREQRIGITQYEIKRQELISSGLEKTDTNLLRINSNLFDLKQTHEALKKRFEQEYPNFFKLKYELGTTTIKELQQSLAAQQTLLEYFTGDSSLFVFVVRQDTFHIEKIPKDFPLEEWISSLRNNLTQKRSTGAAVYCEKAYQLYLRLIAPVAELLTAELTIIPDGVLGYLPFEALLRQLPTKPIRFHQHDYLIREHRINYCFSATLLREMEEKTIRQTDTSPLVAFAPYYSGDTINLSSAYEGEAFRKDLQPLKYSGEEVFGIQKIIGGEAYYGADATENQFQEKAGLARILHLATHGEANDEKGDYSFLAFTEQKDSLENELLFVRDIYNLRLNADLVTLSACETGIGQMRRGEGIISLGRAFTYAGAKSIVTSLWAVNDRQTKDLMLHFYKQLKRGKSKSEALQQAKLSLLKKSNAHPYYWAGMVLIGDTNPLDLR